MEWIEGTYFIYIGDKSHPVTNPIKQWQRNLSLNIIQIFYANGVGGEFNLL